MADRKPAVSEVLPKAGLVVSEKGNLTEVLCRPKLLPLKSVTLQRLEEMEAQLLLQSQAAAVAASARPATSFPSQQPPSAAQQRPASRAGPQL